jgi:hypothetical protein
MSSSTSSRTKRWARKEQGCGGERTTKPSGERAAKVSGESGGGSGESVGVVDLSNEELNMCPEELHV